MENVNPNLKQPPTPSQKNPNKGSGTGKRRFSRTTIVGIYVGVILVIAAIPIILWLTGVIGGKNKSDSTPVSGDKTSPEGTYDGGGPLPVTTPTGVAPDGGGDIPVYPPAGISPQGTTPPPNPYEPYDGLGIQYGKRYLLTSSNIDGVGTYGYGGKYVASLFDDGGAVVPMKFLNGQTINDQVDDGTYTNNQIGFYLMPGLESSSAPSSSSPVSSDSVAPASQAEALDKINTNAYIKSGDKVAIVWPPLAYTKPVPYSDPSTPLLVK